MKKLFTLFIAVMAGIGMMRAEIINHVKIGDLYYNLNTETQKATVTYDLEQSYDNYKGITSINIPESVDYEEVSYSVTAIGNKAFKYCYDLVTVTIPKTVTFIYSEAFFDCYSLSFFTVPSTVTTVSSKSLTGVPHVSYSGSIYDISSWGARSVNGYIEGYLVYADETKTQILACMPSVEGVITIPSTVTTVKSEAFAYCKSLTGVNITDVAAWCGISYGQFNSSHPFNYAKHLYLNGVEVVNLVIPDGVLEIKERAFYGCSGLMNIDVPATVTSIGNNAFSGVFHIRYSGEATGAPWGAKCINGYEDGHLIYDSEARTNILICDPKAEGTVIVPNSVKTISAGAFSGCEKITAITLPGGLDSIAESAFYWCLSLNSINIPATVRTIGQQAFTGCFSLTSVAIPSTAITIGYLAFTYVPNVEYPGSPGYLSWGARSVNGYVEGQWVYADNTKTVLRACSAVAQGEVTIPSTVTELKTYNTTVAAGVFYYCTHITSLVCHAETPLQLGYNTFSGMDCANIPLYVPTQSVDAYKAADQWKEFNPILPIQATALNQTNQELGTNGKKLIKDGQILIFRDGKTYTVTGQEVK